MESSEENIKNIKQCISNMLSKEETIIEVSNVKLSICSNGTNNKFIQFKKEGILCVIVNRIYSCLFLQLYDLFDFSKVFEIELYSNIKIGYNIKDNNFHCIEFPGFFLGISFPIPINNIDNRSNLIHESIISYSKFIDLNSEYYTYLFHFDHEKEKNDYQNRIDSLNDSSNMSNKKKKKKEIDKEIKELENKLLSIEEKINLFNNIDIVESSDNKVYKMVSFHILKSQNKLVKKIYKKNFENFIGTKKINYENIKTHKLNFDFFPNKNDEKVDEKDINKKNFVDYQHRNIIDLLNDEEGIIDEKIQEITKQKNQLKKIHIFKNKIKKITIKEDNE